MTNFLLYGRNDSDFVPADNEDLKEAFTPTTVKMAIQMIFKSPSTLQLNY